LRIIATDSEGDGEEPNPESPLGYKYLIDGKLRAPRRLALLLGGTLNIAVGVATGFFLKGFSAPNANRLLFAAYRAPQKTFRSMDRQGRTLPTQLRWLRSDPTLIQLRTGDGA